MSFTMETDIAVVGAGPAGLSAALAATNAGARVVVLDEYPEPGGQFYKQLPAEFSVPDRTKLDEDYTKGDAVLAAVKKAGVTISNETLVWGAFEAGVLSVTRRGEAGSVKVKKIIVASGAYERVIAFPGWDLPGVMTPGGAQTLVKNQQQLPGSRIVLAGSGPFLLPVAKTLLGAGANIAAIYEATRPREWARHALRLWGHWDRIAEGLRYRRTLADAGLSIQFGRIVVRAEGADAVERVVTMECDASGRTIAGTEQAEIAEVLRAFLGRAHDAHQVLHDHQKKGERHPAQRARDIQRGQTVDEIGNHQTARAANGAEQKRPARAVAVAPRSGRP